MQLRIILLGLLLPVFSFAQNQAFKVLDEKEINFLFNYYEQDGNHSPVTGGIGTEKLNCFAPVTIINVPFDTVHNVTVNVGVDHYTSASSNKIDRFITSASSRFLSSASKQDTRGHGDIAYTYSKPDKKSSLGGTFGLSKEFDVISANIGANYSKSSKNENSEFAVKASLYRDDWKLIYPGEIRNGKQYRFGNDEEDYDRDVRYTSTLSLSYMQVINRRLQMIFLTDLVYQRGILNTPFHRVYFNDGLNVPDSMLFMKTMFPENLPRTRFKVPLGVRVNYFVNDFIVTRLFYRYYFDDFGIYAHTFSIEIPVKVFPWLYVYPLYRYYEQTPAKYFAPFGEHLLDKTTWMPLDTYYTSDWDIGPIINRKVGGGFRFSPYKTVHVVRIKENKHVLFKSLEFRYANYHRSDGLKASTYSIDVGFAF